MHINPKNGHFVVLASGLRAGIEGGYVLWLHAGDHHVPLCFFYVDGFGNGVGHGYLNAGISDALVWISHEYDGDVREPSGPSHLESGAP